MGFLDDVFDFAFGWLMPDPPKQLAPGAELTSAETDASIAKVYGKVQKKNGHIVFKETNDNDDDDYPNDLLHIIVVWGEAVESIDEVYIDDIPNSSNDDAFYSGDKRAVYVRNFKNGMGNYYDPLLAKAGWRDTDKLEGKACSYIRLEYHDDETAITSEPNPTADLTGTTFTNPATALLDYLTNPIYGKGLPASYINYNSFAYAEALCNSDVEEQKDSGEFRDLFSCNISLDTGATVLENVNTLLKPMRGWLPIINGQLTLIVEEDSTPVDLPIIEEDILQMGKITEGNKNNRFNRVSVTYYDPAADGSKQEAVYPEPESEVFDQLLAEDNGFLREESVDLKTCRNYYEALEFAKTYLEVSRQQLRTKITLPKWATIYDVGDIVPVTYMSGLPFWDGKLFRIESKEENREEVILSVREHQPYIYDFFGEGNKPELPDTTYTSKNPDSPTDLNIEHIYDNFVQVKASWVSESQRFDYRVLKGDVIVQTERVASHSVELSGFDMGQYRFQVRALGGLGKRSGWAEIPLVMQVPSPPTSINLNISNFDIEVIPWLENAGSSVSFDYTITDENAIEPGELIRGPAASYTFSGLSPITNYKIWVRSHNPLGVSDWVSVEATTHNDAEPITEIIEPILASITVNIEDLNLDIIDIGSDIDNINLDIDNINLDITDIGSDIDNINLDITDIGSDIDNINLDITDIGSDIDNITDSITAISGINRDIEFRLKTESERRQQSELELLQSEIQAAASREELARRLAAGESLIDAVVYVDPTNGQIVNRAFNYTDESFTNAQLLINGVSGEVDIATQRIETVEGEVTNLSSELSLIPGQITATATSIVNESISALTPAHSFNFFDSAQGWIAVNGTITSGVNDIDVAFGDIENNSLDFNASENQLIRIGIERTSGSGWRGDVIIERDDTTTETYAGIIAEPTVGAVTVSADFRGVSSYNGTINRVRLVLGDSVADEFTITSIIIGKPDSSLLELEGVQARVSQAELDIDANEAAITQRVTVTEYNNNTVTFSNVETTVDGLNSIIDLQATRQELIDNDTIIKANSAGVEINALEGTVTTLAQTVQSNQDDSSAQFIETNERIDAQNGEIVNNAYGIYTERLRNQESDLAALFAEIDVAKIRAGDLSTNANFADAINKINIDIGPDGALAEQLTSLEAFTVINGNLITATNDRVDRVQTDVDGNSSAISGLSLRVGDAESGISATINRVDQVETDNSNNASAISGLQLEVDDLDSGLSGALSRIDSVEIDVDGNAEAISSLNVNVDDLDAGLQANSLLLQSAELDADGNTKATAALNTRVDNVQTQANASTDIIQQSELDANGDTKATVAIKSQVNDPVSGLSATTTLAQSAKTSAGDAQDTADANTTAINLLKAEVENPDTGLNAVASLAQSAKFSADNAQDDADANASAINSLKAEVEDPVSGLNATTILAQSAKVSAGDAQDTADANASAITLLETAVNDPTTGLSATATLAQSAKTSASNAQNAANNAQTDATTALNELDAIANDGVITPQEKLGLNREWQSILKEYPRYVAQADEYSVNKTDYEGAYTQLFNLINPRLQDLTTNSNVDPVAFNKRFSDYYEERYVLLNRVANKSKQLSDANASAITLLETAVNNPTTGLSATATLAQSAKFSADDAQDTADANASAITLLETAVNNPTTGLSATATLAQSAKTSASDAQADATSALEKLDDIANDGVLTPQEKLPLNREWQSIIREYPELVTEADFYGISTSDYDNAYTQLFNLINPRLQDLTTSANVDPTAFNNRFYNYYDERYKLSRLITDETKKLGDNNTTAINLLKAEVDDPDTGLNATASLAQQAVTDAEGNASAITRIASGVTGEAGEAEALIKLDSYLSQGGLGARSFFGTNVNDQVTGIFVNDNSTQQQIEFKSDSVVFVDDDDTPMIYFDVENGRYVFDGEIIADSGTFSGNVSGATITASTITGGTITGASVSGGRVATTQSTSASRAIMEDDGTYMFWIGEGAKNDANGTFWIKKDGTGYIKGSFFEGGVVESQSATGVYSASVSHKSAGKNVSITVGSSGSAFTNTSNAPVGGVGVSTYLIDYRVKRGSTVVESGKINVTRDVRYEQGEYLTTDYYSFGTNLIDSNTSSTTYTYTIEVDQLNLSGRNQKCSISTFENILN